MAFQALDENALWARMERGGGADHGRPADGAPGWTLPGIRGTTGVETAFGRVPAHLLRAGDMIRTRDSGFQRAVRISDVKIDSEFLSYRPDAAPVVIARYALRANVPACDVELSPAHPVFVGDDADDPCGVPAWTVSRCRGTIDSALGMAVYVQVHLARAAQINCDGVWVGAAVA